MTTTDLEKLPLPQLKKPYICYDDGKITRSRSYKVVIKDILRLSDCSDDIQRAWRESSEHLHRHEFRNPYIVCATSYETGKPELIYFAPAYINPERTFWFGLGGWFGAGELDVSGKLTEDFTKFYEAYASEEDFHEWQEKVKEMLSCD